MAPPQKSVLIVDDEATQRNLLEAAIRREGYATRSLGDGQAAIDLLLSPDGAQIGAVILDLSMPKVSGLDVLNAVRPQRPRLPIIVLTAHTSVSNAVQSMRAGATDFIAKPASGERLRTALEAALNEAIADGELRPLTEKLSKQLSFEQLVGAAPSFRAAIDIARRTANSAVSVLIEGESGVGKELIAQSIHSASPRAAKPFIVVNCGALPPNLVESILFGHEKGAFTGAIDRHVGKFAEADGGTIFLDEIGELPLDTQVKLLRVLQEGEIDPVGGRTRQKIDVRVLSATNRDLQAEVDAGRFREDLYYRLNVVQIRIPALRERRDDIAPLARHFIERIAQSEATPVRQLSHEAVELLSGFDWPGNVRQLQNAIFRAVVLCDGDTLTLRDFPQLLAQAQRGQAPAPREAANGGALGLWRQPATLKPGEGHLTVVDPSGHVRPLEDIEAEVIRFALNRYRGRMSEVARRLRIGRSTLYRKIGDLDLEDVVSEPA